MRRIRATNTKPELALRRALYSCVYRFRLHGENLPGKPDIVFTRCKKVVFVNGCFWHSHSYRFGRVTPATNSDFWMTKRQATLVRDAKKNAELRTLGWEVLTVWECEVKDLDSHLARILNFLGPPVAAT